MRPIWIAAVIVALLVMFTAWSIYAKDTVDVKAGENGTVRAEIVLELTDGTTKTLTRIKTVESGMVKVNDSQIKSLSISVAYKPSRDFGKEVLVLSDKSDVVHMSTLDIRAKAYSSSEDLASYPLSLTNQDAYMTLPTGEYTTVWSDVEVTASELEEANKVWAVGTNYLIFKAKFWINTDKDSASVQGFEVQFSVPFTVLSFSPDPPDDDDDDGDGKLDPDERRGPVDWILNENVKFNLGVETSFKTKGEDTSSTAPWKARRP